MVFEQSSVKMPGGRLRETENRGICQISGLKSGRGRLRNLRLVAYELKENLAEEQRGPVLSGRLRED